VLGSEHPPTLFIEYSDSYLIYLFSTTLIERGLGEVMFIYCIVPFVRKYGTIVGNKLISKHAEAWTSLEYSRSFASLSAI